jgi:hypothetical protein
VDPSDPSHGIEEDTTMSDPNPHGATGATDSTGSTASTTSAATSAGSGSDYKLGNDVGITIKDAAGEIAKLIADKISFAGLAPQKAADQGALLGTPPKIAGSRSWPIGDAKLAAQIAIDASAQYQASAFIPGGLTDPDGAVTADTGHAWLKQEIDLAVSVSGKEGGIAFGPATLSAGGSAAANVRLLDYRRHVPADEVGPALIDAIASARFVFLDKDITALDADGCLALAAGGKLALSARVSVSAALGASLAQLDSSLALGGAGRINLQAGASFAVSAALSDTFSVVFSRAASGRIAVALHRLATSNLGAELDFGLNVGFADPDALAPAVESYIEARLGVVYADYQRLVKAICTGGMTDLSALPADLQPLANKALQQLGLSTIQNQLSGLKDKICGLDDKVASIVKEVVQTRLTAQLTFSWSRTTQQDTVLAFEIDPANVATYLGRLLLGDVTPILDRLAAGDHGIVLGNYLDTKTINTSRSFGVSLSLGKWSVGGSTSFAATVQTTATIEQGQRLERRSVDGRREYKGNFLGATQDYFVDLSAAMAKFAAKPALDRDYLFKMQLSFTWEKPPGALPWGDLLATWQVPLLDLPSGAVSLEAAVDLAVTDAGVRAIAGLARNNASQWKSAWAWAMAAALPTVPNLNFRATLDERVASYQGAARYVLDQWQAHTPSDVSAVVGQVRYTKAEGQGTFRLRDIDQANADNFYYLYSISVLWHLDSATRNSWELCEGTRQAFAALGAPGAPDSAVIDALGDLKFAVDDDPYTMRLLGALVVRLLSTLQQADDPLFNVTARTQQSGSVALTASGR